MQIEIITNVLFILFLMIIMLLISLLGATVMYFFGFSFKTIFTKGLWLLLLPVLIWLYGHFVGRNIVRAEHVTIESPNVPAAFDGYTLVQLSDIHLASFRNNNTKLTKIVNSVNDLKPNMIVFTGDLITLHPSEMDGKEELLVQLQAPDGVFSVLGNHDYASYYRWENESEQKAALSSLKQRQRQMGWDLLLDEHRIITHQSDSIALIGVENISSMFTDQSHGNLANAMKGAEAPFTILLSHDPSHWDAEVAKQTDIDLMLSGHTHAMQFTLFGWTPAQWVHKYAMGLYQQGKQYLYVSKGLGETLLDMRLGAVPEITYITLRRK